MIMTPFFQSGRDWGYDSPAELPEGSAEPLQVLHGVETNYEHAVYPSTALDMSSEDGLGVATLNSFASPPRGIAPDIAHTPSESSFYSNISDTSPRSVSYHWTHDMTNALASPTDDNAHCPDFQGSWPVNMEASPCQFETHLTGVWSPSHSSHVPATHHNPSVSSNSWLGASMTTGNPSAATISHVPGFIGTNMHPSFFGDRLCVSPSELSVSPRPFSTMLPNHNVTSLSNTAGYDSSNAYPGAQYPPTMPIMASPPSHYSGTQLQPYISPVVNQRMDSRPRARRSISISPYAPRRTSPLPVHPGSPIGFPNVMPPRQCEWINDDGSICGGQITKETISQHLVTHGIQKMAHNHPTVCRWKGCKLRGERAAMNRESIVRHVREKHLGYKRTTL